MRYDQRLEIISFFSIWQGWACSNPRLSAARWMYGSYKQVGGRFGVYYLAHVPGWCERLYASMLKNKAKGRKEELR